MNCFIEYILYQVGDTRIKVMRFSRKPLAYDVGMRSLQIVNNQKRAGLCYEVLTRSPKNSLDGTRGDGFKLFIRPLGMSVK